MTRRHRLCTLLTVLCCLALLLAPQGASGQDAPVEIRVAPPSAEVVAGETVDLGIEVVEVQNLYGFDVTASFDPDVVEVVDADPGLAGVQVAMGLFLEPGFVLRNEVDNEAGTARLALTQLNPSPPKSGTGILFVLTLRGKVADTSSPIGLLEGQLAGPTGTRLQTMLVGGAVDVVSTQAGEPTYTPIPTQGPGTPMPTRTPRPTPAPGTDTPVSPPTATPTRTAEPGTPAAETTTLTPTSTVVPAEPTVKATEGAPEPVGTSPGKTSVAPPPSATPQGLATSPAVAAVDATPSMGAAGEAATVAIQGPADSSSVRPGASRETGSDPARTFLWISLGAAGLALLLGGGATVLVLTRRRQRSGGEEDAGP